VRYRCEIALHDDKEIILFSYLYAL